MISLRAPKPPAEPVAPLPLREALAAESEREGAPALPARADLCVIGGGFTGLWTAIHAKLADPTAEVALLEAGVCGGGASGRNGGFLMTAWSKYGSLAKICGDADARTYAYAVEGAIGEIAEFCVEHAIEAEFDRAGWVWAATNPSQVGAWQGTVDTLAGAGFDPYRELARDEVAALTGSPVHLAGIFEPLAATINPGLLVRGLRRVAAEIGVAVCERTAVTGIEAEPAPVLVTDRGSVAADTVVIATSAWAAAIPQLRSQIVVVASDVVATDPIPSRLDELGVQRGLSISDSRRAVHYYRFSGDGRLYFGKGGGGVARGRTVADRFERDPARAKEVQRHLSRLYPALWDVAVPHSWRGAVDYALTGLPFIGRLPGHERVLVATGFSGNGVTPSFVAGRHLAMVALERGAGPVPEALGVPAGRLPPEPLLFVGGEVVRRAVHRRERAEDGDRNPSIATRAIARLDPTSFVDSSAQPSEA